MEHTNIHKDLLNVDFSEIKFSKHKNTSGKRFLDVYYEKNPLQIKIKKTLKIPFDTKLNQYSQLEFNVSLKDNEEIIGKINDLDNQMQDFADLHGWCEKEDLNYTPSLKQSNFDFPPTLKFKIPIYEGKIKTKFFNKDKQLIEVKNQKEVEELLIKNTLVQVAFQCVGVWFMGDRYGLTWKANQVMIMGKFEPPKPKQQEYTFLSGSSDEENSDIDLLGDD